jgi:hypothetical protein
LAPANSIFQENFMAIRTIARLYDSYDTATETVRELERAGIPHDEISVVANNAGNRVASQTEQGNEAAPGAEIGAGLGAVGGGAVGVLTGLGLFAIPGVGPVVAAGWLVALAVGAVGGAAAGGLLGGLIGAGIGNDHAEIYAEGVRRGGTLVTVRVPEERATIAEAILDRHAVDPVARREEYAAAGWSAFDPNGPLFTDADIERERRSARG